MHQMHQQGISLGCVPVLPTPRSVAGVMLCGSDPEVYLVDVEEYMIIINSN